MSDHKDPDRPAFSTAPEGITAPDRKKNAPKSEGHCDLPGEGDLPPVEREVSPLRDTPDDDFMGEEDDVEIIEIGTQSTQFGKTRISVKNLDTGHCEEYLRLTDPH